MKNLFIAFAVLFLTACNQHADTAEADNEIGTYKVVGVKDGDTVELLKDEQTTVVRLQNIDCPEKAQPYGKQAKQFTSDLCFGKNVRLLGDGKRDKYNRVLGIIMVDSTICVNKELVRAGLAWHYKYFSKDDSYAELENAARAAGIGLWNQARPTPPWDFRRE